MTSKLKIASPETAEYIKELIRARRDGASQNPTPAPITGTFVSAVLCGTEVDTDNHVYNGTTCLLDPETLEWVDNPGEVYLWGADSTLTTGLVYLALGTGYRTIDDTAKPLFYTIPPTGAPETLCREVALGQPTCIDGEIVQVTEWWKIPSIYVQQGSSDCAED